MKLFSRVVLVLVLAAAAAPIAGAQTAPVDARPAADIDDEVAAALHQRGVYLAGRGDDESAKKMFVESLERSPDGPVAADALAALRDANRRLGLEPDDGRPAAPVSPLDPYGAPAGDDVVDPYASDPAVLDPYGQAAGPAGPVDDDGDGAARKGLMLWSGLGGLTAGLALAGPEDDEGNLRGGAVVAGLLGAGSGVALSYYLGRKRPLSAGQSAAVASAGTWGGYTFGMLGDVFTGDDSDTNDVYKFVAAGAAVGVGLGAWYALELDPGVGEVAFANSLGMYGSATGLLLGVAIDPPRSEAYSLNAALGSVVGLAAGFYLQDQVEVSRRRMLLVDLGALAGATASWVLVYPLISEDGTSSDEQAAGLLSAITLAGGAITAWILTDDDDPDPAADDLAGTGAALLRRGASGGWSLGVPLPRPMESPALAPVDGAGRFGIDLATGRF